MLVNLLAEAGRLVNKLGPCCDGPTDCNLLGCLPLDSGQGLNGPPSPNEHGRTRVETKSVAVKHLSVYSNV